VAAMSVLAALFNRGGGGQPQLEQRTLTSSAFVPPPQVGVIDDYLGVHRAMACMTVLACVRVLADTIASLPWKAYRRDAKGVPKEVKPQPTLLASPFPGFDLFQWKWMVVAAMALRGNSYHMTTSRDKLGYPTSLLPLHPDVVFLERRPDLLLWFDPIYRIMGEEVPTKDMVHMRRFTLPGEPWGLSPVKQAAVAIGMSLGAEEYGYRYFKESANPSGILFTDQDLDEKAVTRQQKNWIASHGGRRLPAVLTNGFKWETITVSPEESQFLATRGFQRSEICMMYGVPLVLLGETEKATAWGTGIQQLQQGAVTFTFRAWTSCIESMISGCLPRGQFVRFDYDSLLRGDIEARYKAYGQALGSQTANPWMVANEIRANEEMDPIDGGDTMYISNRMMPVGYPPAANNPPPAATGPGTLPMPPLGGGEDERSWWGDIDTDAESEAARDVGAPRNGRSFLMRT
jgi:HK97 family phage portal protein